MRVEGLRKSLEEWHAEKPPVSERGNDALSLFCTPDWFEVNYSYTLLLIYRGILTDRQHLAPIEVSLECLNAAANVCHRYRRQFVGRNVGYTWGAVHFLILAGLTYLHILWTSEYVRATIRSDQISSVCSDCTMVLVVLAERWQGAAPYRDIFEALASRTMTMLTNEKAAVNSPLNHGAPGAMTTGASAPDEDDWTRWLNNIDSVDADPFVSNFINDFQTMDPARNQTLQGS
jgi:hypothetical protein